jgi:hypothetical protein
MNLGDSFVPNYATKYSKIHFVLNLLASKFFFSILFKIQNAFNFNAKPIFTILLNQAHKAKTTMQIWAIINKFFSSHCPPTKHGMQLTSRE